MGLLLLGSLLLGLLHLGLLLLGLLRLGLLLLGLLHGARLLLVTGIQAWVDVGVNLGFRLVSIHDKVLLGLVVVEEVGFTGLGPGSWAKSLGYRGHL